MYTNELRAIFSEPGSYVYLMFVRNFLYETQFFKYNYVCWGRIAVYIYLPYFHCNPLCVQMLCQMIYWSNLSQVFNFFPTKRSKNVTNNQIKN